jgi:hypothetical protein
MRIDPVVYMEWAKLKPEFKFNLTRSGMPDCRLADFDLDRRELEINGEHSYGYPPLIEGIASRYHVAGRNVMTTNGASEAVFLICASFLEPGDEVLVEKPAYGPLLDVPRFLKAEIKRFERRFEDGYLIDLDHFRSSLSSRTKLVVLTNVHNPSGALLSAQTLKELAGAAAEAGAMVLVDEIYLEFVEGKAGETSFHLADNIIVASSLTKVFGLGGLRCGWIIAPAELIENLKRLVDHVSVEGVFVGEQISALLLAQLDSLKTKNRALIAANLSLVRDFIRVENKLSWVEPAPGIICFPRVEARLDGVQLARILSEKFDTGVVPGHFFEEPKHFRLGFGVSRDILTQGLENIRSVLRNY